jgi:hypothetical protein
MKDEIEEKSLKQLVSNVQVGVKFKIYRNATFNYKTEKGGEPERQTLLIRPNY